MTTLAKVVETLNSKKLRTGLTVSSIVRLSNEVSTLVDENRHIMNEDVNYELYKRGNISKSVEAKIKADFKEYVEIDLMHLIKIEMMDLIIKNEKLNLTEVYEQEKDLTIPNAENNFYENIMSLFFDKIEADFNVSNLLKSFKKDIRNETDNLFLELS